MRVLLAVVISGGASSPSVERDCDRAGLHGGGGFHAPPKMAAMPPGIAGLTAGKRRNSFVRLRASTATIDYDGGGRSDRRRFDLVTATQFCMAKDLSAVSSEIQVSD